MGPRAGIDATDVAASTRSCCTLISGCSVAGPNQPATNGRRSMVHSLNSEAMFRMANDAGTQLVACDKENIDSNSAHGVSGEVLAVAHDGRSAMRVFHG